MITDSLVGFDANTDNGERRNITGGALSQMVAERLAALIVNGGTLTLGGVLTPIPGGTTVNRCDSERLWVRQPVCKAISRTTGLVKFNQTTTGTYSGVLSGTGSVEISGGSVTFSKVNTYRGTTTIDTGTLALSVADAIATSSGCHVIVAGDMKVGYTRRIERHRIAGRRWTDHRFRCWFHSNIDRLRRRDIWRRDFGMEAARWV